MATTAKTIRKDSNLVSLVFGLVSCVLCLAQLTNTAAAATYYVDASKGNDSYAGDSVHPWKTLDRTYTWYSGDGNKVQEGDTVYFKNGNYGTFREHTNYGAAYLFYRNNWITYQAAPGHTPEIDSIAIQNLDKWNGLGDGRSYLIFKGMRILKGMMVVHTSYVQVEDCNITGDNDSIVGYYAPYNKPNADGVEISSANNILLQDNEISYCYRGVSTSDSSDVTISKNTIHRIGEDGMSLSATNLLVEDNLIYDLHPSRTTMNIYGTRSGTFTVGEEVVLQGTNASGTVFSVLPNYLQIYQTTEADFHALFLAHTGDTLIGLSSGASIPDITDVDPTHTDGFQIMPGTNNAVIQRNRVIRATGGGIDGQGFKFDNPTGVTFVNNLIYTDVAHGNIVTCTADTNISNNTITGELRIFAGHSASQNRNTVVSNMHNNIIGKLSHEGDGSGYTIEVVSHGNNIFGNNPNGAPGPAHPFYVNSTELVNYNTSSLFVNAANNDFNLAPGSIAINFGNPSYAPVLDILGNSRDSSPDAGCYEYVASDPNNNAPVLAPIGNKSTSENSFFTLTLSAADADGDTLTYSAQNLPSGATFANQTFNWTPSYIQAGTYPVTFRVSDGFAIDSETIVITVSGANRPPVLAAIGSKPVNENSLLSFTISATDPDGDTITYSTQNLPTGAAFANRTFTWTPGYTQAGTYQVTFTASDGQEQDSETVTITVVNVNRAPVLAAISGKPVYANDLLNFTISATDPDGDTLTYSATNLPSGATFANRTFNWTPSAAQAGTYQVTFIASDGALQDSEAVTITVLAADTIPPKIRNISPAVDSIQTPLNSLVILHITDDGKGVDAASVSITLNGSTIYTGDTAAYTSSSGRCSRTGSPADYTYIYQPDTAFNYDQTISVAVNAADLADNAMSQNAYSFQTEMRSFGKNKSVNSSKTNAGRASPATVRDSSGNIYAVWHSGTTGTRNIYLAKLSAGQDAFSGTIELTADSSDQCNPVIAIDTANKLYLVWQDNRSGNWDIYGSTSSDGLNWATERKVSDSNNNETNPAIIIDKSSPQKAYVAWQDDSAGNQEIFIASSSDSFASNTVTRITNNSADQTEPALAVTAANVIYVAWTDMRNGNADTYAAVSNSGPWSNVPVVTKSGSQTSPAIAAESAGSIVHLLWVDDSTGNRDVFYASSNGLTGTTLTGTNIIDDASGKDQIEPAIAVSGAGSTLKVFACWQDKRNISGASNDTDLYFVQTNSGSGTNIFVGDDSANSNQTSPALAIDAYGYPYAVWVDDRNSQTDIYYVASTFVSSSALASANVTTSAGATVGTSPAAITSPDDVSIVIPAGGVPCSVTMSISMVNNPSKHPLEMLSPAYDFGPSGIYFEQPVTITIPYTISASGQPVSARWYNVLTGQLSQQGITDIQTLTISPTLAALQFKTTHFTQFVVVESAVDGSGGGGGGCSMGAKANPAEFFLPYAGLGFVMVAIKRHDIKKSHSQNRSR